MEKLKSPSIEVEVVEYCYDPPGKFNQEGQVLDADVDCAIIAEKEIKIGDVFEGAFSFHKLYGGFLSVPSLGLYDLVHFTDVSGNDKVMALKKEIKITDSRKEAKITDIQKEVNRGQNIAVKLIRLRQTQNEFIFYFSTEQAVKLSTNPTESSPGELSVSDLSDKQRTIA